MSFPAKMRPSNPAPSSGELDVACSAGGPPPRLLHDFASFLIVLIHSCFKNMANLPFPLGNIIKKAEKHLDPWTHPLVEALERFALGILAVVDGQIYATSGPIKGCILRTSARLKSVTSILSRRGLIGMSADFWVKNEAALKEHVHTAIDFANKYPLLGLITHVFGNLSSPLARAMSDWLVKQSEVEEKGIQSTAESNFTEGELLDPNTDAIELQILSQINDTSLKKEFIASAEKGFLVEEASLKKGFTVIAEKEIEEVKKIQDHEEPANSQQQKNDLPDVLELIDSGWLLGSAALTPKSSFSSAGESNSKLKKRYFNR